MTDPLPAEARNSFGVGRFLFLRALGLVYLAAFVSFGLQASALIGSRGIAPAAAFLEAAAGHFGPARFWSVPTLFWIGSGDRAILGLCAAGAVIAIAAAAGMAPRPAFAGLWLFYLSLYSVGGVFLSFQWDALLLEAGFLALFLAEPGWRVRSGLAAPSPAALWLVKWLLFRLMVLSGLVKWVSDPVWRNLDALRFHFETQPLPTPFGWAAHQFPPPALKIACAGMFGVELFAPFLLFGPRRVRHAAALLLIGFQLLIMATGNYAFFNWLTIALCLVCFDDAWWVRRAPFLSGFSPAVSGVRLGAAEAARCALAAFIVVYSAVLGAARFGLPAGGVFFAKIHNAVGPLQAVNTYGLFADMTTERPEIVLEGSADGKEWLEYEFKYKPQDVMRPPGWVAPHQPRLDWQMWFAALGGFRRSPWFPGLCRALLLGSPEVRQLFARDPFAGTRPKFIRGALYQYRFTDRGEMKRTRAWWKRERLGLFAPPLALKEESA